MINKVNFYIKNIFDDDVKDKLQELNLLFMNESYLGNKVAFYYENLVNGNTFSYNENITFYAASTMKILVCLYLLENSDYYDLDTVLLVSEDDKKQGSGILKDVSGDQEYTLLELIKPCIIYSDNTAYIKLMDYVGKDIIKSYGEELGCRHIMEGKEADMFGITNCVDLSIIWKRVKDYIDRDTLYSDLLRDLTRSTYTKLISDDSIGRGIYLRKYGSFGIAYHEAGIVINSEPYVLIVMTQLNEKDYKEEFINNAAKLISELHYMID